MKKSAAVFLLLTFLPVHLSSAEINPEQKRRIDELKRENLDVTASGATAQKPPSLGYKLPLSPADTIYIAELTLRRVTYGYDLCKLIVMLKGVENEYLALDAQVQYLQEQNLLPKKIAKTFDPMRPLHRGVTAYGLRKVLNIKGGVFLRIFKDSQRYALKELAHEGIMSSGNIHEVIAGDELSAAFTNTINYLEGP